MKLDNVSKALVKATAELNNLRDQLKRKGHIQQETKQTKESTSAIKTDKDSHKSKPKNNNNPKTEKIEKISKEQKELYKDAPKSLSAYFLFVEQIRQKLLSKNKEMSHSEFVQTTKNKWSKLAQQEKEKLKIFVKEYNRNQYKIDKEKYMKENPGYKDYLQRMKKNRDLRKKQKEHNDQQEKEEGSLSQS